jgi:hypothetical protein
MVNKQIRALFILSVYLLLLMQGFSHAESNFVTTDQAVVNQLETETHYPCQDGPCKDGHEKGECNATCSCCSNFTPLPQGVISFVPPRAAFFPIIEPFLALPLVYAHIFVPPQNRS